MKASVNKHTVNVAGDLSASVAGASGLQVFSHFTFNLQWIKVLFVLLIGPKGARGQWKWNLAQFPYTVISHSPGGAQRPEAQ